MKTQVKTLIALIAVFVLSIVFFTGAALAQEETPDADAESESGWLAQMQQHMEERWGPGAWADMIARMTERHGAEFTAERLQWMEENGCPMLNNENGRGPMHRQWQSGDDSTQSWGPGYQRFWNNDDAAGYGPGSMMGRGMMGRGMMRGNGR
jgi:hypothetical protein